MQKYLTNTWPILHFNVLYLLLGAFYFIGRGNLEFMIYIAVIVIILSGVFATLRYTKFPNWMLWLLSFWGLMHVLGGAFVIGDHVLFAHRIFPLIDLGGDFYVLKYDQVVHAYLYGLVGVMAYHLLRNVLAVKTHATLVFLFAVMAALGVSAMNEIMEFLISLTMENGVGGYDNTMLDICFNFLGALVAVGIYTRWRK